jgi:hypothetical protein
MLGGSRRVSERRLGIHPFFLGRHLLNLLQFHTLDTKIGRHLNDLAGVDEVAGVGAELLYPWIKFAAAHLLGQFEAEPAPTVRLKLYTKFAKRHSLFVSFLICSAHRRPDGDSRSARRAGRCGGARRDDNLFAPVREL